MTTDPEQEPFVDGLTEDLITDLSRNGDLFVIARNSTFAYKGKSVDVRRIASELGVHYLLEGSARRAAGRVRMNVQLIDAIGGGHLWAERFDRNLEDVFAVQDEVTAKIVEALIGRLREQPSRKRPANMEAYDLCVRARGLIVQTALACREATFLMKRAIAIDPEYAEAHRWLALNLWLGWEFSDNRWLPMGKGRRGSTAGRDARPQRCWESVGIVAVILGHDRRWEESDAEFDATFSLIQTMLMHGRCAPIC